MSDHHDRETTAPTRIGALRVRTMGSGPPAALWHSLFVDSSTWARVEEGLACHRRLLIIDGPCHGASAPTTDRFTLDDCAGAACDVLDHLDGQRPSRRRLVGDAFRRAGRSGMYNAIRSASLNRPELTSTLATVNAPTLIVAGDRDKAWPPAEARAASQRPGRAPIGR